MTAPAPDTAEAAFRYRMNLDGDLGMWLCEKLWNHWGSVTLSGDKFRMAYDEEVPESYRDDDTVTLLARESDGKVFEIDIEVTSREVTQ